MMWRRSWRTRNDPEVARYQDWTLPYTGELAHQLIDGMDDLGGPVAGQWVQLAIDVGGTLAGDLGVHLDAEARTATLGFTLDPAHQGLGYATEAAGGLIDRLFEQLDVHRVAATVDPETSRRPACSNGSASRTRVAV